MKVFYNANEGTVNTDYSIMNRGGVYSGMPEPKRKGFIFTGWYISPNGGIKIDESCKVYAVSDLTVYAHWEKGKDSNKSGLIKVMLVGILAVGIFVGAVIVSRRKSMGY